MKLSKTTQRLMIKCCMKHVARHGFMALFWTVCFIWGTMFFFGALAAISDGYMDNGIGMALITVLFFYSGYRTMKYIDKK